MNLLAVRKMFVQMTGRYDLVENAVANNWTDKGANAYINSGMQELERMWEHPLTRKKLYKKLETGQSLVYFTTMKAVERVWVIDPDRKGITELEEVERFPSLEEVWLEEPGLPRFYRLPVSHLAVDNATATKNVFDAAGIDGYDEVLFPSTGVQVYDTISLFPKPGKAYTLVIEGKFLEPPLSQDTDTNIWTSRYTRMLAYAACMVHAAEHKNTSEVQHWLDQIQRMGIGIEKDNVDRLYGRINQMKG